MLETEHALWAQFVEARDVDTFAQSWLALQCRQITGVNGGAVLVQSEQAGAYAPVAVWPDARRSMEHLTTAAQQALTERRGVLQKADEPAGGHGAHHVAYPVEVAGTVHGVVVLEVAGRSESQLQAVLRQLHWGIAWLTDYFRSRASERDAADKQRLTAVLDLVATTLENEGFQAASTALATELATRLNCDRVSVGFVRAHHIRVQAISHSAQFKHKSNLVRDIGAAMDEAVDQQAAVLHPEQSELETGAVSRMNGALAEQHGAAHVCSVPFRANGVWAGALTLERTGDQPFDRTELELCEGIAALVGPVLDQIRLNDRWIARKAIDSTGHTLRKFVGPGHLGWKLTGLTLAAVIAFFAIATGTYRVTADAMLEGAVQRSLVAPFSGYIEEAPVRAGDIVEQGDVLAVLDDRDLQLDRLKWASQRDQLLHQYRQAKAERDRAQIRVLEAQLGQAKAELALLEEQLQRTRIKAPFDGMVVSGDLSQSLGAPVERGEVLFELAPLDRYRLVLQVDDRDVEHIEVDQKGALTLSALPDQTLPFVVEKITPVATAEEGRNFFRVEARLAQHSRHLRPGMEGVGKVAIGERKLIWIWTHGLVDWFRLWVWSWWP